MWTREGSSPEWVSGSRNKRHSKPITRFSRRGYNEAASLQHRFFIYCTMHYAHVVRMFSKDFYAAEFEGPHIKTTHTLRRVRAEGRFWGKGTTVVGSSKTTRNKEPHTLGCVSLRLKI